MLADDNYQRFGTPLDPIEEDAVPSKRPVYVEDQIVTDENGRRRFHGAFTGGFSAGYWNTVGSQEGWMPQSFKSSRSEKAAERQQQRPEDFMDDEDLGEFGIAPQRLQVKDDFSGGVSNEESARKRKFMQPNLGPIPGVPVLHELLKPEVDKIAVRMLKNMGWRPGQGAGARLTRKEKKEAKERNKRELYVMERYGCDTATGRKPIGYDDSEDDKDSGGSDDDDDNDEITYAPDDYEPYPCTIKNDYFGLGYTGLNGESGEKRTEHVDLFTPLEVLDKNNKKLSISGQAFGVGALEEEDEDIYARDDMSKYDFSLEDKKPQRKKEKHVQDKHVIDGFAEAKEDFAFNPRYTVELPSGFKPRNWGERKSRFEPLDAEREKELNAKEKPRQHLKPTERGQFLGEVPEELPTTSKAAVVAAKPSLKEMQDMYKNREARTKELLERISSKSFNFTQGGIITAEGEEKSRSEFNTDAELEQEKVDMLAKAQTKTAHLNTSSNNFKPFLNDERKQQRYEAFLAANLQKDEEISTFLNNIQPVELSEWDREMEKKEFIQARKIYKPLGGIMSDRFVSESTIATEKKVDETEKEKDKKIVMQRTKTMWKPCALLCKRYNIAEPFGGTMAEEKKPFKPKLSVFDYLETSVNTKSDFQTPVIIPKHIEKPKPLIKDPERVRVVEEKKTEIKTVQISAMPEEPKPTTKSRIPTKGFVPKTELEKRVVESLEKPPAEKVELFRAIFEDDSDEEPPPKTSTVAAEKVVDNKAGDLNILTPNLLKHTSAAAANLLRNNSPPRGIFAALFSNSEQKPNTSNEQKSTSSSEQKATSSNETENIQKISAVDVPAKITFKSKSERETQVVDETSDIYGPKLPAHLQSSTITTTTTTTTSKSTKNTANLDEKLLRLLEKQKSAKFEDVWVEKTMASTNVDSSTESEADEGSSDSSSDSETDKHKNKSRKSKKQKSRVRDKYKSKKKSKKKNKKREKSHKSKKSKRK